MPQFDPTSFSNQVLCLFFVFSNLYFLITYWFLPLICKTLKFRKKKIELNQKTDSNFFYEKTKYYWFSNQIFQNFFSLLDTSLSKINKKALSQTKPLKIKVLKYSNIRKPLIQFWTTLTFYPKQYI
jgi:hypothetical protein